MDSNFIIIGFVIAYMLICIWVGLWAMRRTKDTSDFFVAGRNLGVLVAGIAMFSSIMSGFGFVGGPGLVFKMGLSSFWILISTPIGFCLAFFLLAKPIRLIAEKRNSVSLPDIVDARFQSKTLRFHVSAAILFGVVAYLAVQIKAMATVLRDIWNRLCESQQWELMAETLLPFVIVSSAVLVFYCVTGGIIASVYTDLFQGIIMVIAAFLIFIAASMAVEGGFPEMARTISEDDREAMGPWGTFGIIACLSWHFLFAFGVVGQPHVVTKLMMTKKLSDARGALPLTIAGYSLAALLWIGIGLAMRTLVLQGEFDIANFESQDSAAPQFLLNYVSPWLAGIVFAGLFAAIMSTADGFLNIGSAAVVHDLPRCFSDRPIDRQLLWARVATLVLAILSAVFAMVFPSKLLGMLGIFGFGVFASTLAPVFGFGLNWKHASPLAAIVSVQAGILINVADLVNKLNGGAIPYGVAGGTIGLLVSSTVFIGISLFSKPKDTIPDDVAKIMDC
ncbi:MAG: hypothetical protein AAF483_26270 [Planctomycetota bacterium]